MRSAISTFGQSQWGRVTMSSQGSKEPIISRRIKCKADVPPYGQVALHHYQLALPSIPSSHLISSSHSSKTNFSLLNVSSLFSLTRHCVRFRFLTDAKLTSRFLLNIFTYQILGIYDLLFFDPWLNAFVIFSMGLILFGCFFLDEFYSYMLI